MDFFPLPYKPVMYKTHIVQPRTFTGPDQLSNENLEEIILKFDGEIPDEKNLKGIVAEIIANSLVRESFKSYLDPKLHIYGNLVKGREGFLINTNHDYLAKLITQNRIVILKKEENNSDDEKFGFRNIAEIDGLYIAARRRHKNFVEKKLFVIESKSGEIKMDPQHIREDIIRPLEEMYESPVTYMLIGFKDFMYRKKDAELNSFNNKLYTLWRDLNELNIDFMPMHFPFSHQHFESFVEKLNRRITGITSTRAKYFEAEKKIELYLPDGSVLKGSFTPE